MDVATWTGLGCLYVVAGMASLTLARELNVEGAEAVPWFIFWPIFYVISVIVLTGRALRSMFK